MSAPPGETIHEKALRLLLDGYLTVQVVGDPAREGLIVASCRGDHGDYRLGFDPERRQWRCTCPARKECAHLIALKLVVFLPTAS